MVLFAVDNRQPPSSSMEMDAAVTSYFHYVYFLIIQYMQTAACSSGIPPLETIMIAQSPWSVTCINCSRSDAATIRAQLFPTCSCIGSDSVAAAATWMRYMVDILNNVPNDTKEVVMLTHDALLLCGETLDRGLQTAILSFCRHYEQLPICGKVEIYIVCAMTSRAAAGNFCGSNKELPRQMQAVADIIAPFAGLHITFIDCSRIHFDTILRQCLQRRLSVVNAILSLPSAQALHASVQLHLRPPSLDAHEALLQVLQQIGVDSIHSQKRSPGDYLHFTLIGRLSRSLTSASLNPICYRGGAILVSADAVDTRNATMASNRCIYRALQKSMSSRDELLLIQMDALDSDKKPMRGVSAYGVLVPPLLNTETNRYHNTNSVHPDMVLILLTDRESHIMRSNCEGVADEEMEKEASLLKEYVDQALLQVPAMEQYNPLAHSSGRYMISMTQNSARDTQASETAVYQPSTTQPFLRNSKQIAVSAAPSLQQAATSVESPPPSHYKRSTVPLATGNTHYSSSFLKGLREYILYFSVQREGQQKKVARVSAKLKRFK